MSLLTGQAAAWSLAVSSQQHELINDFRQFTDEMRRVFDHPVKGRQATSQLLDLQQGNSSVSEYAVNFRILAAESGWNDSALQAIFCKGLAGELKDELAVREECNSFNSLVDLAIRLDNRIRERVRERQGTGRRRLISGTRPALQTPSRDRRTPPTTLTSHERHLLTSLCNWVGPVSPQPRDNAGCKTSCASTVDRVATSFPAAQSCQKTGLTSTREDSGEPHLFLSHRENSSFKYDSRI